MYENIISSKYFYEINPGSVHDANAFGNYIFHMNTMLSPIQSMIYDYTEIFGTVSFLKTTIIHCNINVLVDIFYSR